MKTVQWALSESVNQYLNICRINRNEIWCKSSRFPNGETQWLWWPSDLWFRMKCRPWNIFRSFTANQRCSFLLNSNWSRCWLVLKRKQKNPNKLTWRQLTFKPAWNDVVLRQWKEPGPGISSDAICCNKLFFFYLCYAYQTTSRQWDLRRVKCHMPVSYLVNKMLLNLMKIIVQEFVCLAVW